MNNPFDVLSEFLDAAWSLMVETQNPMRRVSLATLDATGAPQQRTLVLREADSRTGTIALYTDAASDKVPEIAADGRVSLLIWDESALIQIRATGRAQIESGDDLRLIWDQLTAVSHGNYGVMPTPGTAIGQGDAYDRRPDAAKFARILIRVDALDLVQLVEPSHRRARFRRVDAWRGQWLAP